MEFKRFFKQVFLTPSAKTRPLRQELYGGPISLTKVLQNAIKMKATYSGGLVKEIYG